MGATDPPLIDVHVHTGPGPFANVEIDNRGGTELCAYRDIPDPDWSPNLALQVRPRGGGQVLEGANPGYVPRPIDGLRIVAGHSTLGRRDLTKIYPQLRNAFVSGRWEVKASFSVHHCGDSDWQTVESAWEPL